MNALMKVNTGEEGLQYIDVPEPKIKSGELLVKIHACGICASDIHMMHGTYPTFPPVILGHEYSGTVVAAGPDVTDFEPGDRIVSLTPIHTCGRCEFCQTDLRMLCPERRSFGGGRNGAFAAYAAVPAEFAFRIPEKISLDAATLCEPLACAVRGVLERTEIKGGDNVLISGPGIIGQLAAQVARACGGTVAVAGTSVDKDRLGMAETLGACAAINIDEESIEDATARLTNGRGFDVAFECAGAGASMDTCIRAVRKTGLLTQLGLYGKPIPFNFDMALMKEVLISNSYAAERSSWKHALRLLQLGLIRLDPLLGSKFPLKNWREALQRVEEKLDFKVLLIPD